MTILTLREAANYLRIHEMTLYRMAARGIVPGFKVGGRWRFAQERIEEHLNVDGKKDTSKP